MSRSHHSTASGLTARRTAIHGLKPRNRTRNNTCVSRDSEAARGAVGVGIARDYRGHGGDRGPRQGEYMKLALIGFGQAGRSSTSFSRTSAGRDWTSSVRRSRSTRRGRSCTGSNAFPRTTASSSDRRESTATASARATNSARRSPRYTERRLRSSPSTVRVRYRDGRTVCVRSRCSSCVRSRVHAHDREWSLRVSADRSRSTPSRRCDVYSLSALVLQVSYSHLIRLAPATPALFSSARRAASRRRPGRQVSPAPPGRRRRTPRR